MMPYWNHSDNQCIGPRFLLHPTLGWYTSNLAVCVRLGYSLVAFTYGYISYNYIHNMISILIYGLAYVVRVPYLCASFV